MYQSELAKKTSSKTFFVDLSSPVEKKGVTRTPRSKRCSLVESTAPAVSTFIHIAIETTENSQHFVKILSYDIILPSVINIVNIELRHI
jgi:hypothetical protein